MGAEIHIGSTLAFERPRKSSLRKHFRPEPSDLARPPLPALTRKQSVIARLLIGMKSNREIAIEMGCSEQSIRVQVSHMYRRTGTSGRLEFIRWYARKFGKEAVIRELLGGEDIQ